MSGLCPHVDGADPIELTGVAVTRAGRVRSTGTLRRLAPGGRGERVPLRELRGLVRLIRLVRRTVELTGGARRLASFDIVHANDLDTLPSAWLIARRFRARLVYDAHELYTAQEENPPRVHAAVASAAERLLARRSAAIITVSEPLARELTRRLGLRRPPLVVLNCPARAGRDPEQPTAAPPRVVYQGALSPSRHIADLLLAVAAALAVTLAVRLTNVDVDELRDEVRRSGLARRVEILAPVAPDRLVEALQGYEVGIVLNRGGTANDRLGFPNKLFEYMMAGLAVAVPALPGVAPFVESHEIGLTFEPREPAALAEALEKLARDRTALWAMRRRARRLALDDYNAERQASVLEAAWGI